MKQQQKKAASADYILNSQRFKLFKSELCKLFDGCDEPGWLNLLLIENSKDYHTNKINTHAVMIAKSFEKWCFQSSTAEAIIINKTKDKINFDLQLCAFKLATEHHTILLDAIVKSYDLDQVEVRSKLYPHVVEAIQKFDYKDKALCIAFLAMQELFDVKTV